MGLEPVVEFAIFNYWLHCSLFHILANSIKTASPNRIFCENATETFLLLLLCLLHFQGGCLLSLKEIVFFFGCLIVLIIIEFFFFGVRTAMLLKSLDNEM